jgi:hypothetical protein
MNTALFERYCAMALMVYDDWEFRPWENLLYSVTTGVPACLRYQL